LCRTTFTEANAHGDEVGQALSTAFDAYVTSNLKDVVAQKIAELPEGTKKEIDKALFEIIKTHPLRIKTEAIPT